MPTEPVDWIERAKEYSAEDSQATANFALIAIAEELRRMNATLERKDAERPDIGDIPGERP